MIGCFVRLQNKDVLNSINVAHSIGAKCCMVYTDNPKFPTGAPIEQSREEITKRLRELNMEIVVHAPYAMNLCVGAEDFKRERYIQLLIDEIKRADSVGAKVLVVHPGNTLGHERNHSLALCALNIVTALAQCRNTDVKVAVEFMAGKGTEVCNTVEDFRKLMECVHPSFKNRVGICMDTCHLHDAGYDMNSRESVDEFFSKFRKRVDGEILCFHISGSLNPLGSHKDRHANLKDACNYINVDSLIYICEKFPSTPKVLETPVCKSSLQGVRNEIDILSNRVTQLSI